MAAIPVFVRNGAVLPTDEAGADVLALYPPDVGLPEPQYSSWYRDAGDGYGPHRIDDFSVQVTDEQTWTVTRTADEASYPVDDTDLAVVLHGGPWTVSVDGGEPQTTEAGQARRVGDFAELVVRRPA